MKNLLTILIFFFFTKSNAQTANAGSDVTIYLTQTSTATLDGSASSATSYHWQKIQDVLPPSATFPTDNSIITSSTSKVTTVTGLEQGVWYYELSATTGGVTKKDTVVVRVDYSVPPGTLLRGFSLNYLAPVANLREDTTTYFTFSNDPTRAHIRISDPPGNQYNFIYFDRDREQGALVDSSKGLYYSTIADGWDANGNGYSRSELDYGLGFGVDSNKIYCFEWKGYYPQPLPSFSGTVNTIFQLHGNDGNSPPFAIRANGADGTLNFSEINDFGNGNGASPAIQFLNPIANLSDFYGKTHTIRITLKEGKGNDSFVKVEVDGVQKYYRNTGQVGTLNQSDYARFGTLYDSQNQLVSPTQTARGRRISLATEGFKTFITDSTVAPPAREMSGTQNINTDTTTIYIVPTWSNGHTGTITWSEVSGPTSVIVSPNSSTTKVTNLTTGTYLYRATLLQDDGQTTTGDVLVNVILPPSADAGPDQIIILPQTSATLSGRAQSTTGHVSTYLWSKVSGSGTQTITNNTTLTPTVNFLNTAGDYVFELRVTQDDGQVATDNVKITVQDAVVHPKSQKWSHAKTKILINRS